MNFRNFIWSVDLCVFSLTLRWYHGQKYQEMIINRSHYSAENVNIQHRYISLADTQNRIFKYSSKLILKNAIIRLQRFSVLKAAATFTARATRRRDSLVKNINFRSIYFLFSLIISHEINFTVILPRQRWSIGELGHSAQTLHAVVN